MLHTYYTKKCKKQYLTYPFVIMWVNKKILIKTPVMHQKRHISTLHKESCYFI